MQHLWGELLYADFQLCIINLPVIRGRRTVMTVKSLSSLHLSLLRTM